MTDSTQMVYGLHAVQSLLKNNAKDITRIYLDAGRKDGRILKIRQLATSHGVGLEPVNREKLVALSQSDKHQGVVAEIRSHVKQTTLEATLENTDNPLILILDSITDPHNLGACLRTADAVGATCVIYPKDKSAGITPTVRKIACGAAETVTTFAVTNLARTMEQLQSKGIWIIGAAGEADKTLYDIDLSGPVALVMGAEGAGLRRLTREKCDYLAKLPMQGAVSSLNVSVATGICLYEALRQRTSR